MLVINSIEKTRLSADSFSYSGSGVAWKARLVLFLGFALMAGGLAGSVVGRMRGFKASKDTNMMMVRRCWYSNTLSLIIRSRRCTLGLRM